MPDLPLPVMSVVDWGTLPLVDLGEMLVTPVQEPRLHSTNNNK